MAAMKPRTGNGPMEAVVESRKIVMRIPSDGGGRLVVELNAEEASELGALLLQAAGSKLHCRASSRAGVRSAHAL